jgi:magnesium-transporting ATPase (P-type)
MIALTIIIVVNSTNNYLSELRLAELLKLSEAQEVAVYRGSNELHTINSDDLVVGDIIKLENG